MSRLFVAVWPPPAVLDQIEALPRAEEPGVRWISRPQWHVTLRFLGDAEVEAATEALQTLAAASCQAPLGPVVRRLGRGVVMLPAAGLEALAASVASVTVALGEPPDPRPFTGHLTLARLRHRGQASLVGSPFEARFGVHEVHLVRSDPRPEGARYETVAVQRLGE